MDKMTTNISETLLKLFSPPKCTDSYFFSFEGIEGAGKSTHIKRLKNYLENEKKLRVVVIREPGGTDLGEKLRTAILNAKTEVHPVAEAHLFASSRAQLLYETTLNELNRPGTVVICDRYIDSSIAYQGKAGGLGTETILQIHGHFPLTMVPHQTIYIDISLETSLERQRKRNSTKDYFESKDHDFYQLLIDGYREAHQLFPERILMIDGEQTEDDVYNEIQKAITQKIAKISKND